MSDEEAERLFTAAWKSRAPSAPGTVLDEFVRRLGTLIVGSYDGNTEFSKGHHVGNDCCRPAVLFVQREAEKVVPENCPCRLCERSTEDRPDCCTPRSLPHCVCCGAGVSACLKCGRQPAPKPLSDAEKIQRALAVMEASPTPWMTIIKILRGEAR